MSEAIPRSATAISWVMMIVALLSPGFLAWYIPMDRRAYEELLKDFKVEIPALTLVMISIPDIAFPTSAAVLGLLVVLAQWLGRGSIRSTSAHMVVVLLCAGIFVAYRESLFEPIATLMRGISSQSSGG